MAPSLRTLSRQEHFCADSMRNLVTLVNNYDEQRDKFLLEGWKRRVEEIFTQFQSVRLQIELDEDEDEDEDEGKALQSFPRKSEEENRKIRDEFERNYMMVYGFIVTELRNQNNTQPNANNVILPQTREHSEQMFSRIKLPEVKLPAFDGSISNWLTFRDSFVSMIDSNPQLKPVDKFTYLLSSLSKEAKRVIESIELTGANYTVAWELLKKRFDNKKLVVKNYIDSLLSIEPMRKECYESLTRIIDDFERNLSMIQKMGIETDGWSVLLAHMMCVRLEGATLKMWEQHHHSTDVPTYEELIEFLRNHASVLQSLSSPYKSRNSEFVKSESVRPLKPKFSHAVTNNPTSKLCIFCKTNSHSAFHCEALRKMNVSQRFDAVKKRSLCINCLSPGHLVKQCPSSSCRVCGQKHHTMLHQNATFRTPDLSNSKHIPPERILESNIPPPSRNPSGAEPLVVSSVQSSENEIPTTSYSTYTSCISTTRIGNMRTIPSTILLQTALVKVSDLNGYEVWARALLDPASQLNLITEQLAQRLTLRRFKNHQEIGGVGNSLIVSSHTVVARIHSHCTNFIADLSLHVLPGITRELPSKALDTKEWKLPTNIMLADPTFNEPSPIDMILGMEVYYDLIEEGLTRLGPELPVLQKTVLGWVVSGKVGPLPSRTTSFTHLCNAHSFDEQLARLFEIEACQSSSTYSVEETYCEAHFSATTIRNDTGRFIVQLPKRSDILSTLGSSKEIATRRFFALERRLTLNPSLKQTYLEFIEEYRRLGHMKEVASDRPNYNLPTYYLPHHCIVKPESLTTKLRVVFDASCATTTGVSLNDGLMVGPVVQDDLIAIILRFRTFRYAIISDIEKMYRQIVVHPSDRPLQQILWRNSPNEPLQTYQLTTVTYGTSSAPYLATRCVKELSNLGEKAYPLAARATASDFYMDDLLTGVDNIETGQQLCKQMIQLHQSAGFCLRKWSSNCSSILEQIPAELRDERTLLELDSASNPIKTLGLQWQTMADQFLFNVPRWSDSKTITKRVILSDAAKLFDPLGLVGPAIVTAKIYLQHLWRSHNSWDEPLDQTLCERWLEFRRNLESLKHISVPRWVIQVENPISIEMHGFCDASEKAYGACLYLRAVSQDGNVNVNLLVAKSKVAPLGDTRKQKKVCLPRLELSSALLLSHLYQKVQSSIKYEMNTFFWTDSTIVLHWLASTPSRWKTFVANRVSEIQHVTSSGRWNHVSGTENPADIISRGMDPAQLQNTKAWWNGPHWLSQSSRIWPTFQRPAREDFRREDLEEQPISLAVQHIPPNSIFALRSSLTTLLRLVAWIQRFRFNIDPGNRLNRRQGQLRSSELEEALVTLVRIAQQEAFREEFESLSRNEQVNKGSKLRTLVPFVSNGLLRVRGRLRNAVVSSNRMHPMILPYNHPFTTLVVQYYHKKMLHAGPQLLIASIREKFWPLRVRNLARKVVHSCVTCFRCRPKPQEQIMGDLPPERVSPTLPFISTGVDLCGPLYYRHPQYRSKITKCYVAIFICLSVKAVHIELVGDLSTGSFIAALRRFVARRGKPKLIECDNATNFKGATRELRELEQQFNSQQMQQAVQRSCADDRIEFKFIPPRSPNFGGLWEAAVKSVKTHLRATLGNSSVTAEQLTTLLAQIESCLNSRPLTQLSADPEDLDVLTPGHFLIHRPLSALAEPSLESVSSNRLDRWQIVQEFLRRLWKRWNTEYLSSLQPRTKWTKERDNIRIGTMVLVKEDNLPPLKWRYGRVTHIFKGHDGKIRVVVVKTKDGEFRRAISRICVLPIRDNSPHVDPEA